MKITTACTMDCGDACSLLVDTEKKTVRGNPKHPFTKGFCCKKGGRYFERIDSEDRLTEPLVRRGTGFEPVSWDEAMTLIAEKLDAARAVPESILHIHGHGYRGILGKSSTVFFDKLGASTDYGSLCDDTGIEACIRDFGVLNHNDPEDILNADRVVNWGRDMTRCSIHQLALLQKARKNGTEVLTISPGGDGTPEFSDVNVMIRPGTDRFLAAAVLKLFLEAGDLNPWVLTRTANWPALRGLVDGLKFRDLCAACEVPARDAEMVYEWYADRGRGGHGHGLGVAAARLRRRERPLHQRRGHGLGPDRHPGRRLLFQHFLGPQPGRLVASGGGRGPGGRAAQTAPPGPGRGAGQG